MKSSSSATTVKVMVRTRPTSNFSSNIMVDSSSITVNTPQPGLTKSDNATTEFNMNTLHNVGQQSAYDTAARDVVQAVIGGCNGTIMAYGQTGAGKTFTMSGDISDFNQRGINVRAIEEIFKHIEDHRENSTDVKLSYLEIYQEQFRDLLGDGNSELKVRSNKGVVHVQGLKKVSARTEQDALEVLFEGENNRTRKAHKMNPNSTRSHCVFTIYLETRSLIESLEKVIESKLHLVDLAGSERVGKTGSTGETLIEAQYINRSLSHLEQVVLALSSRSRSHIPFRQSKLTNLLSDSLGGNCKTRLIANISGEQAHLSETLSTLRFAQRMSRVTNEASVNIRFDADQLVKKYRQEIKELKQELVMHDTLANREGVKYEPYTPEQQTEIRGVVSGYVRGEIQDIDVVNLRQIKEVFKQFKNIILDQQIKLDGGGGGGGGGGAISGGCDTLSAGAVDGALSGNVAGDGGEMVGDIDDSQGGFHLGRTANNAGPSSLSQSVDFSTESTAPVATEAKETVQLPPKHVSAPDESVAFEEYKQQHSTGIELHTAYQAAKAEVDKLKKPYKDISQQVNECKRRITKLGDQIREKHNNRDPVSSDGVTVIDEEEFELISEQKKVKAMYKALFAKHKEIKEQHSANKATHEKAKLELADNFLNWYKETYPETEPDENEDKLDDGELFDKLEREAQSPESLAFFNARKGQLKKKANKIGRKKR